MKALKTLMLCMVVLVGSSAMVFAQNDIQIDYVGEQLTFNVDSGYELRVDGVSKGITSPYKLNETDFGKVAVITNGSTTPVTLPIPARPARPVGLSINYTAEYIGGASSSQEYIISDSSVLPETSVWTPINSGTTVVQDIVRDDVARYYFFRVKAIDGSSFASLPSDYIRVMARPEGPNMDFTYSTQKFKTVNTGVFMSTNGTEFTAFNENFETGLPADELTFYFRTEATNERFRSKVREVVLPAAPEPLDLDVLTINYEKETLSTTTSMQYQLVDEEGNVSYKTCSTNMKIEPADFEAEDEKVYYIRKAPTATSFPSDDIAVTIPNRPAAVAINDEFEIDYVNEIIKEKEDSVLDLADLQYATSETGSFTTISGPIDVSKLSLHGKTIYVRKKAVVDEEEPTRSEFATTATEFEIPGRYDTPTIADILTHFIDYENEAFCDTGVSTVKYDYYNTTDKKWYPLITKAVYDSTEDETVKKGYFPLTELLNKGTVTRAVRISGGYTATDKKFPSASVSTSARRDNAPRKSSLTLDYTTNLTMFRSGTLKSASDSVTLYYAPYITSTTFGEFKEVPATGVAIASKEDVGYTEFLEQGKAYAIRQIATADIGKKFLSKQYKFTAPKAKKAPKVSWVPTTELFKGVSSKKHLYSIDEGVTWKLYEIVEGLPPADLLPNPTGGGEKGVYFRSVGSDNKTLASVSSNKVVIPERAQAPIFGDGGVTIDYAKDLLQNVRGLSYKLKDSTKKFKVISARASTLKLKSLIPKNATSAVYEFKVTGTATAAASDTLEITINERMRNATVDDISYNYIDGSYSAGNFDLLLSTDNKNWLLLPANLSTMTQTTSADLTIFNGKAVRYKLAYQLPTSNVATGKPASAKSLKYKILKTIPFAGTVMYDPSTGKFTGNLSELQYSKDGKTNWIDASTLTDKVEDGKYYFRTPPTLTEPASRVVSVKAKYVEPQATD